MMGQPRAPDSAAGVPSRAILGALLPAGPALRPHHTDGSARTSTGTPLASSATALNATPPVDLARLSRGPRGILRRGFRLGLRLLRPVLRPILFRMERRSSQATGAVIVEMGIPQALQRIESQLAATSSAQAVPDLDARLRMIELRLEALQARPPGNGPA
jgi:hypothetical protein